jgi:wyosine [tRNA(Phe)-imidazoG37] synthetase (radical SAM superfamily)
MTIAFGPIPSRRLGFSLGVNHVLPKYCPYSCVYCQVGRTTALRINRQSFFSLDQIIKEVEEKISDSARVGQVIDYLTLVPDGEPTLDINLAGLIQMLMRFRIPVAVISNASLIDRSDVQEALLQADWVSMKVDAIDETVWRRINRPHRRLSLTVILAGILNFRKKYSGKLVTETMLVSGINDNEPAIDKLVDYLSELQPFKSYLSIPTRPPAESWVIPPSPETLQKIITTISKKVPFVDLLFEAETANFISTGNLINDILSIIAVHPLREEALRRMVTQAGAHWKVVEDLVASGTIACIVYREEKYYLRYHSRAAG